MPSWWIIPVIGALILAVHLTHTVRKFAKNWGVTDAPDGKRKHHKIPTPLLGGVAIFLAFTIPTVVIMIESRHFTAGDITAGHIAGFLAGATVLIIGGIIDDKYTLPPKASILFPIIACAIAVLAGIGPSKITNPAGGAFELTRLTSSAITFSWLMVIIYTTKLLDGLDGLTASVGSVGFLMIALLALSAAFYQPDVALMALIAFAATAGFALWNLPPAHIFLGEGGSTLIGYMLGTLAIISGSKIATALLVIGVPAIDILFVIRSRRRRGVSIKSGDRSHLHLRLKDAGFSSKSIVAIYTIIATCFGLTTLIFSSWQKLVALIILFTLTFLAVSRLSKQQYA